jgi:hypothetical protein
MTAHHHYYRLGAHYPPSLYIYHRVARHRVDCARAYSAGMIARLFGVDLSAAINS